jgi:hypothetical protein
VLVVKSLKVYEWALKTYLHQAGNAQAAGQTVDPAVRTAGSTVVRVSGALCVEMLVPSSDASEGDAGAPACQTDYSIKVSFKYDGGSWCY